MYVYFLYLQTRKPTYGLHYLEPLNLHSIKSIISVSIFGFKIGDLLDVGIRESLSTRIFFHSQSRENILSQKAKWLELS